MQPQILVPLDGSKQAEAILPPVAALARAAQCVITLVQVHVPILLKYPLSWAPPAEWVDEEMLVAHDYLAHVARHLLNQGVQVHIAVLDGHPATNILAYANEHPAVVLIAMASHERNSLQRVALGNVAEQVIASASKPVMLLYPQQRVDAPFPKVTSRTVVVPLDGTPFAEQALAPVQRLAIKSAATVVLVSVVCLMEGKGDMTNTIRAQAEKVRARSAYLESKARQLQAAGVRVRTEVILGKPAVEIQHACEQSRADMIVMAVHERNIFQRLHLAGTAVDILRDVHLPVLLVRVREREAPVQSSTPVFSESERK